MWVFVKLQIQILKLVAGLPFALTDNAIQSPCVVIQIVASLLGYLLNIRGRLYLHQFCLLFLDTVELETLMLFVL